VRVEATPPDLEAVMEIDRGYFARHPHRHYYCRRMYEAERAQQARAGGHLPRRPGVLDVVVVQQLGPGMRMRRSLEITGGPTDTDLIYDTDLPEEACRKLFFLTAGEHPTIRQLIDTAGRVP
jgi:hypothetical protein